MRFLERLGAVLRRVGWTVTAILGLLFVVAWLVGGAWKLYVGAALAFLYFLAVGAAIALCVEAVTRVVNWFRMVTAAGYFIEHNREAIFALLESAKEESGKGGANDNPKVYHRDGVKVSHPASTDLWANRVGPA